MNLSVDLTGCSNRQMSASGIPHEQLCQALLTQHKGICSSSSYSESQHQRAAYNSYIGKEDNEYMPITAGILQYVYCFSEVVI